jgi:outer membrane protein OmpA-like peptidoglycan-associated protein
MSRSMKRAINITPACALLLAASLTLAAERRVPSSDDLINKLTPAPSSRSFGQGRGVTVEGGTAQAESASVDLEVNFEFNSTNLTTDAMLTLDNLSRALKDPRLASYRFQIAGHTDGVGSDAFNQKLSDARAKAVREYLVTQQGVEAQRLESIGYGESHLLDKTNPESAVNRRVQITNIGG